MHEAQVKVSLAIQKKEQELAKLKEKEKQINKKITEKEKKAEEDRIKKLGRMMEETLKKKYGNSYFKTKSMDEVIAVLQRFLETEDSTPEVIPPTRSIRDENVAGKEAM